MKRLPREIGKLGKLIQLDIAYSGAMLIVPETIKNLRNLEILYVDRSARLPSTINSLSPMTRVIYK